MGCRVCKLILQKQTEHARWGSRKLNSEYRLFQTEFYLRTLESGINVAP